MTGRVRSFAFVAALLGVVACDQRANPRITGIRPPPVTAPSGDFKLVAVDDLPLPHSATNAGTVYTLVSGTLSLHTDSTWLASTVETLSTTGGMLIGTSPANYVGTWSVTDSTLVLSGKGTIRFNGDSLFWRGAPKHTFEDTLKFTMVKK